MVYLLDFIIKYWLQALFGVIAAGLGIVGRKIWKQWLKAKKALEEQQEQEHEARVFAKLDEHFNKFDDRLDDLEGRFEEVDERFDNLSYKLNTLEEHDQQQDIAASKRQKGILALVGEQFMAFGAELLDPNHKITYEEYTKYDK